MHTHQQQSPVNFIVRSPAPGMSSVRDVRNVTRSMTPMWSILSGPATRWRRGWDCTGRRPRIMDPMPRAGLQPERVVTEAVALVDEVGLDQLSMGALAKRLGVRPPSLYNHIKNSLEAWIETAIAIRARY